MARSVRTVRPTIARIGVASIVAIAGLIGALLVSAPAAADDPTATLNLTVSGGTAGSHFVNQADVTVYQKDTATGDYSTVSGSNYTDSDGYVPIAALPVGDNYYIGIGTTSVYPVGPYSNGYVKGSTGVVVPDITNAAPISLAAGTNTLAATLNSGTTVKGSILDPTGATTTYGAFATILRYMTDPTTNTTGWVAQKTVNIAAADSYSITGVAPGKYLMEFSKNSHPELAWGTPVYNTGSATEDAAAPFYVHSGETIAAQNGQFVGTGGISGTVTLSPTADTSGQLGEIDAYPLTAGGTFDDIAGYSGVSAVLANGDYSLANLYQGDYALRFVPSAGVAALGYRSQWYLDRWSGASAVPVHVSTGGTTTGTDFTIGQGFTLTGTVTAAYAPLVGMTVTATQLDVDDAVPSVTTTVSGGQFSFDNLQPGPYSVQYSDPNHVYPTRYYTGDGSGTILPQDRTEVDGVRSDVGAPIDYPTSYDTVDVSVANRSGTALASVAVQATAVGSNGLADATQTVVTGTAVSGQTGTYRLAGLANGVNYALHFTPTGSVLRYSYPQYLGGGTDLSTAQTYTPAAGTATLAVTLVSSAALSGTVKSTGKKELSGVSVYAWLFDGSDWTQVDQTTTSSHGAYSFPALSTGSYAVEFATAGGKSAAYVSAFSGGASTASAASHFYVSPAKATVYNATLSTGGSISGTIYAPDATTRLSGIGLEAYRLTGTPGAWTGATPLGYTGIMTSSTGAFTIPGLAPGSYAIGYFELANGDPTYADPYLSPVDSDDTPVYTVASGKTTTAGQLVMPFVSAAATASVGGTVAGMPDGGDGTIQLTSETNSTELTVDGDGIISGVAVPGTYTYTTDFELAGDATTRFTVESGTVVLSAGANTLSGLTAEPATPLVFVHDPQLNIDSGTVGTEFTLSADWNHPTTTTVAYRWFRGADPIYGAKSISYTAGSGDVGATITARVTVTDSDGTTIAETVSTASTIVESTALVNTVPPSILPANAYPGGVLRVDTGSWNGITGLAFAYQWSDNGTPIDGATKASFTPTLAELYHSIDVDVTASKPGYASAESPSVSATVGANDAAPTLKTSPKVTRKTLSGGRVQFTVSAGSWSLKGGESGYDWTLDGSEVDAGNDITKTYIWDPTLHPGTTPAITVSVDWQVPGHQYGVTSLLAQRGGDAAVEYVTPTLSDGGTPVASTATPVTVGDLLYANAGNFIWPLNENSSEKTTYTWQRQSSGTKFVTISHATGYNYVVTASDLGKQLRVVIATSTHDYATHTVTLAAGTGTANTDLVDYPASVYLTGNGTARVPFTAQINDSTWQARGAKVSLQWLACKPATGHDCSASDQYAAVSGQTKATFGAASTHAGQELIVRATATLAGYTTKIVAIDPVSRVAVPSAAAGTLEPTTLPTIKTTSKSWTVSFPELSKLHATLSFTWYKDGAELSPQVTSASLTRIQELAGHAISVRVGWTDLPGYVNNDWIQVFAQKATVTRVDAPTAPVPDDSGEAFDAFTAPTVAVEPEISGYTLLPLYQWLRNGKTITGATNIRYTTVAADAGTTLSVRETLRSLAVANAYYTSTGIQVDPAPAVTASIAEQSHSGDLLAGTTLTSIVAGFSGNGSTAHIQWQSRSGTADFADISKATSATYKLQAADAGKDVRFRATVTAPGRLSSESYSDPDAIGYASVLAPVVPPSLSSAAGAVAKLGKTLTLSKGTWNSTSVSLSYQWTRNGIPIPGVTGTTYTPTTEKLGAEIAALVTAKKVGFATVTVSTEALVVATGDSPTVSSHPTITGTVAGNSTLTASTGSWNVDGLTFSYLWTALAADGVTILGPIDGTDRTLVVPCDDLGDRIMVQVTASRTGYQDGIAHSSVTTTAKQGTCP